MIPNPSSSYQPLESPAGPKIGLSESTYSIAPTADGWTRITVKGARGSNRGAVFLLFPVGAAIGALFGFMWWQNASVGAVVGLAAALILVAANVASWDSYDKYRTPAGFFDVSAQGLRLANGKGWNRHDIGRVLYINTLADRSFVVQGAFRRAHFDAITPLGYQLEVEAEGRRFPVVGCMTQATAAAVFNEVLIILDMQRS